MQVLCMYLAKSTKRSSLDDVLNRNVSAHVQAKSEKEIFFFEKSLFQKKIFFYQK